MANHRYWRCDVTAGTTYIACAKLVWRLTSGGTDQTTTGGSGFADSFYAPESLVVANAYDADINTKWASNGTGTAGYIGWDFGAGNEKDITAVAWTVRNDGSWAQVPSAMDIQWSDDGSTYTTEWSITSMPFTGAGQTIEFVEPAPIPGIAITKTNYLVASAESGIASSKLNYLVASRESGIAASKANYLVASRELGISIPKMTYMVVTKPGGARRRQIVN